MEFKTLVVRVTTPPQMQIKVLALSDVLAERDNFNGDRAALGAILRRARLAGGVPDTHAPARTLSVQSRFV